MKKGVLLVGLIGLLLVISLIGVQAANETVTNSSTTTAKTLTDPIDKAYDCLENKIGNRTVGDNDCTKMTLEEMTFSVMATGQCENELMEASKNDGECWPKSRCDVKSTAQAIWALNIVNEKTEKAEAWILEQKSVPRDLVWYLQIETANKSKCEITYEGNTYVTEILENRKVASNAGSCLSVSENGFWLSINPDCYDYKFEIKCKESSITNLLFREKTLSTIHVLDKVDSAVNEGTTIQQIESFCFLGEDSCDYEGTLWATIALDILDYEISEYVPYLITGKEANLESFPLPFLYILTGYNEYKTEILSRQINDQYWQFSNGKYFDTALALLPFQNKDIKEKKLASEWLLKTQGEDGCWDAGNIRNNAFLLYSIWPRAHSKKIKVDDDDDDKPDNADTCTSKGFFCMSGVNCGGNLLDYSCFAPSKCCDVAPAPELCSEQEGGKVCLPTQFCSGGTTRTTEEGECCVGGVCKNYAEPKPTPSENTCADKRGVCETFACGKGYSEDTGLSCSGSDICCVAGEEKSSYLWIWILFILIVLIAIAIIYRDKIKEIIEKMQKGSESTPKPAERKGPSFPSRPGVQRPGIQRPGQPIQGQPRPGIQRPSMPRPSQIQGSRSSIQRPASQNIPTSRPLQKSPQELDNVLKKLKEMSK